MQEQPGPSAAPQPAQAAAEEISESPAAKREKFRAYLQDLSDQLKARWTPQQLEILYRSSPAEINMLDFAKYLHYCHGRNVDPLKNEIHIEYKKVNKNSEEKRAVYVVHIDAYRSAARAAGLYDGKPLAVPGMDDYGYYVDVTLHIKGDEHPTTARAYYEEYKGYTAIWNNRYMMTSKVAEALAWRMAGILVGSISQDEANSFGEEITGTPKTPGPDPFAVGEHPAPTPAPAPAPTPAPAPAPTPAPAPAPTPAPAPAPTPAEAATAPARTTPPPAPPGPAPVTAAAPPWETAAAPAPAPAPDPASTQAPAAPPAPAEPKALDGPIFFEKSQTETKQKPSLSTAGKPVGERWKINFERCVITKVEVAKYMMGYSGNTSVKNVPGIKDNPELYLQALDSFERLLSNNPQQISGIMRSKPIELGEYASGRKTDLPQLEEQGVSAQTIRQVVPGMSEQAATALAKFAQERQMTTQDAVRLIAKLGVAASDTLTICDYLRVAKITDLAYKLVEIAKSNNTTVSQLIQNIEASTGDFIETATQDLIEQEITKIAKQAESDSFDIE